ncbi:MAG: peptidoglycan DD-metalloendopeptidase family protein [Candidatus Omnitrophica bacterium]|nr:peptidoglycan DD-metalloendopeptidase family protein [Candidatus Omnitrophota bacterium]
MKIKIVAFLSFIAILLSGCVTVSTPPNLPTSPKIDIPGIYHKVEKGQTLWRISKIYDINLEELAQINKINDTSSIEVGQLIFIPHRQQPQVIPIDNTNDDFIWPIQGKIIAGFGIVYKNMLNKGVNIHPTSSENVVASRGGKVVFFAEHFGPFGKTIIINHADGLSTVYARNKEVFIKAGDIVQKGALIAKVGNNYDADNYLHFEIRKGHTSQNPLFYLP